MEIIKIISACIFLLLIRTAGAQSTVYVNTATALQSALNNAVAGQTIVIEDGYYERSGGFYAVAGIHGTTANPIKVIGSRNVILSTGNIASGYGFSLKGNNHWIIKGFSIRVCKDGVMLDQSKYITIDSLDVRNNGNSGIHLRTHTSYSVVKNCFIDSAGMENPSFGEGIYIGSAYSNWCTYTNCDPDTSNYNQVLNNVFGSAIAAENVDIKEGTRGGLVKGNSFNGAGLQNMNGGDSWIDVKGNYYVIDSNIGSNTILDGFQTHIQQPGGYGNYNRFSNNVINMNASGYGIKVQTSNTNGTAYGNEVCNNNTLAGSSAGLTNVTAVNCTTILPVIILDWNVAKNNNRIIFNWSVSSTDDILVFDIQQSVDGSIFSTLLQVPVNGISYYKDTLQPDVKGVFFRIGVKLKNGKTSYTKTLNIEKAGSYRASISNDQLVVLNPAGKATIRIMNVMGQTLGIKHLQPGYNYISLNDHSTFYFLNVIDQKLGSVFTQKLSR